jgi:hypothetical protein
MMSPAATTIKARTPITHSALRFIYAPIQESFTRDSMRRELVWKKAVRTMRSRASCTLSSTAQRASYKLPRKVKLSSAMSSEYWNWAIGEVRLRCLKDRSNDSGSVGW